MDNAMSEVRRSVTARPDLSCTRVGRCALVLCLLLGRNGSAEPTFRYPEGTWGQARLQYVNQLPVMEVRGTPREIGAQVARLALEPASRVLEYPRDFLRQVKLEIAWPLLSTACQRLARNIPGEYTRELESIASSLGRAKEELVVANTMFDVLGGLGCSTLIVGSERSATQGPLFGRNLDFPTLGYLQDYSLVTIFHPRGKKSFVAVTFPGCVGVLSGMNSAGLALAVLEVYESRDQSVPFDPRGTPYAICCRRILEECATVDEAGTLLREMQRTNWLNLAICDARQAAILEMTPQTVAVRPMSHGYLPCTNHFRSPELRRESECWRYAALQRHGTQWHFGRDAMQKLLHEVNQGDITLQTMIFEPARLKLHLAIGPTPTSALPLQSLNLVDRLR